MAQPTLLSIAKALEIQIPERVDKYKTVYTSWEAVTRYYPQKIIRRDMIKKAIGTVQQWHTD